VHPIETQAIKRQPSQSLANSVNQIKRNLQSLSAANNLKRLQEKTAKIWLLLECCHEKTPLSPHKIDAKMN
jgi:hypothetical protein